MQDSRTPSKCFIFFAMLMAFSLARAADLQPEMWQAPGTEVVAPARKARPQTRPAWPTGQAESRAALGQA